METTPVDSQQQPEPYEPPAIVSRQPVREPVIASINGSGRGICTLRQ